MTLRETANVIVEEKKDPVPLPDSDPESEVKNLPLPESPKEKKVVDKARNLFITIKTNVSNFFTNLFKP